MDHPPPSSLPIGSADAGLVLSGDHLMISADEIGISADEILASPAPDAVPPPFAPRPAATPAHVQAALLACAGRDGQPLGNTPRQATSALLTMAALG